MSESADVLAHRETVMGVLPLGTGNSFAQTLGIPAGDLDGAVRIVAAGHVRRVDLGVVNGRHFANFATVGLSARAAKDTPRPLKRAIGQAAYGVAGLVQLARTSPFEARIRSDAGTLDVCTRDILIVNGRYYGITPITPDASDVDGRLKVYTTADGSRLGTAAMYGAILLRKQMSLAQAHFLSACDLRLKTSPRQYVNVDGNVVDETPARFNVARRALRVIVPAGFGDGRV